MCVNLISGSDHFYLKNIGLTSHDCEEYNQDVLDAESNGTLDEFSKEFDRKIYDALMQGIADAYAAPWNAFSVYYNSAACSRYCYYERPGKDPKTSILVPSKKRCGVGCCIYYTDAFYGGSDTGAVFITYIETEDFTACISDSSDETCKRSVYQSDCIFTCE